MRDETLLLTLRAEALCSNLRRLRGPLVDVPARRRNLEQLKTTLEDVRKHVNQVRKAMIDFDESLAATRTCQSFKAAESAIENAHQTLKQALDHVDRMKTECFSVQDLPVGGEIATALQDATAPVIQEVMEIEEKLRTSKSPIAPLWGRLRTATSVTTAPMFADYVELLGGVALRDARFDEGISEVADELLRSYVVTGTKPNFVAIPTREEAIVKTLARIIRVTFPDWTIWALPSTALEFWNAVASQTVNKTLEVEIRNLPPADATKITATDRNCLGDAYATFTMGPAYGFFAITLMLNPEADQHHARARAILAMLKCMDNEESLATRPYQDARQRLLNAWNAGREQLGQKTLDLDLEGPDSDDKMDDARDPEGVGTRILVRAFARVLANVTTSGFVVDVWSEIQTWVPHLLARAPDQIQVPKGAELRHVLNAAWLARTDADREATVDLTPTVQRLRELVRQKGK